MHRLSRGSGLVGPLPRSSQGGGLGAQFKETPPGCGQHRCKIIDRGPRARCSGLIFEIVLVDRPCAQKHPCTSASCYYAGSVSSDFALLLPLPSSYAAGRGGVPTEEGLEGTGRPRATRSSCDFMSCHVAE